MDIIADHALNLLLTDARISLWLEHEASLLLISTGSDNITFGTQNERVNFNAKTQALQALIRRLESYIKVSRPLQ